MEPGGILDSAESKMLDRLVEKRIDEMQEKDFCIITNADIENIKDDIRAEIFLKTGRWI